jgi:NhaP-type Na+/H+ or K+/H+ antiporter
MTDVGTVKMLDAAAVSVLGRIRIETWTAEYDLMADAFSLTVYWQCYGYGQHIPTASFGAVVAMFEAASRARAAVFYDGQAGNRRWSIAPVAL